MTTDYSQLSLRFLGVDTYTEPVIYMRKDCHICVSEGFEAPARIQVKLRDRTLIATLNTIESNLLHHNEASLSHFAWNFLSAKEGDKITVSHPQPLNSLSDIRAKVYGHELQYKQIKEIVNDVVAGRLSDIEIAMFLTATAGERINVQEILNLTQAMIESGERLSWPNSLVVDKHCVGGLPGNRTTLIVVPIVAAFGLMIPKTSSRSITSPAGTADVMEVFASVTLDIKAMQKVVEQENGCIIWGGAVSLSPADDILIRIERTMDVDLEGQLIASILSKKIAAGSSHILIDMPIGETAKIRSLKEGEKLKQELESIARQLGVDVQVLFTDGSQPVGRGIGPALEAQDVFAVLSCDKNAAQDLRDRALTLAGCILEFSPQVEKGTGRNIAESILNEGRALQKFEAICRAQGGMFEIPKAPYSKVLVAGKSGKITRIDNRLLGRLAKLSGAPNSKAAGVHLEVALNSIVEKGQPLFTVYADTKGELRYALDFHKSRPSIMTITEIK